MTLDEITEEIGAMGWEWSVYDDHIWRSRTHTNYICQIWRKRMRPKYFSGPTKLEAAEAALAWAKKRGE